jgi:GT2 family glycosyltransferase
VYLADNYSSQPLSCLKKTEASIIAGRGIYPFLGESFEDALKRANKFTREMIHRFLLHGNWLKKTEDDVEVPFVSTWSLVKREVFDRVKYNNGYKGNAYREETDFCINALKQGFKVFFCPHTYCFHLPREVKSSGGSWARGILYY